MRKYDQNIAQKYYAKPVDRIIIGEKKRKKLVPINVDGTNNIIINRFRGRLRPVANHKQKWIYRTQADSMFQFEVLYNFFSKFLRSY